ncbi:protein of unknown function [Methylocella tundrae]|uniref:Uncharacterized protein n=1 Tax=Methylocella tundrae TaxID=227605 RepID=A0A4U8Z426_METTU|nr:protein of unknown function [Methylocella tundrae]
MANTLIFAVAPTSAATVFLLFSLMTLIACSHWLEVPWIVSHLERLFDRTSVTKAKNETE